MSSETTSPASTGWLRSIGPGLVTACVVIGPGSILTSSKVGAANGYNLIWVVCVAVLLPTFVQVLAFVGCACVGFVSFCVPPILHLRIVLMTEQDERPLVGVLVLDVIMLVWGLIATALGTIYTLG